MDKLHYEEMLGNFNGLKNQNIFDNRHIYLFGHCNATEILADMFIENGYIVRGILDNNKSKQGNKYRNIRIMPPEEIMHGSTAGVLVCIVSRAYEAMAKQLYRFGFAGRIEKLVDYNSFAEYSLSEETIARKTERVQRGIALVECTKSKYPGCFRIYCPFAALGDVYYAMSYLPYFLENHNINEYVVCVVGSSCAEIAGMFGVENIEVFSQKDMDESVQAVLYTNDRNAFIAHHDRPYTIYLSKALHVKMIPLENMYKYGVFALDKHCRPFFPVKFDTYKELDKISAGKSVIISPYAKSVANISWYNWQSIVEKFKCWNYKIFTNVANGETALEGTEPIPLKLSEIQTAVERAGVFIGLRSGLCDVIKYANCRKIALYPDCFYSDTKWKVDEIFHLDGWENIVIRQS